MKKRLLTALIILTAPAFLAQGNPNYQKVKGHIDTFFQALNAKDTATLKTLAFSDLSLRSIPSQGPVHTVSLSEFLKSTASIALPIEERTGNYQIMMDGRLCQVWMEYSFYLNGNLHHCGANSFTLLKESSGWKISDLTDTRRGNCAKDSASAIADLDKAITDWHRSAATADADAFFGFMTEDCVYIGTDPGERWLRDELRSWSKSAFERESAWDFSAEERHITIAPSGNMAWFDESLQTWMGICHSTGILQLTSQGWKLKHYQLSVTVANEKMDDFREIKQP